MRVTTRLHVEEDRYLFCGDEEYPCRPITAKTVATAPVASSPPGTSQQMVVARPMNPVRIEVPAKPAVVRRTVLFEVNSSDITDDARSALRQILSSQAPPEPDLVLGRSVFVVEGFTDDQGNERYNTGLALERAQAVKAFLVEGGIPEALVAIGAHGKCCYAVTGTSKDARRENRRAVVTRTSSYSVRSDGRASPASVDSAGAIPTASAKTN